MAVSKIKTQRFTSRAVNSSITRTSGASKEISAPGVDGYRFVCWVGVSTVGWFGNLYIADYSTSPSTVYVNNVGTLNGQAGSFKAIALYQPN